MHAGQKSPPKVDIQRAGGYNGAWQRLRGRAVGKQTWSKQERGLLEAIHENPRDDGVRLIYADWLAKHGQREYAEFIRLQCEQARLPHEKDVLAPETARETELLRQFRDVWAAPFLNAQAYSHYHRGMPVFQIPRPGVEGTLRAKVAQAFRYGSPRHHLSLVLAVEDVEPLRSVLDHPLMNRVHWILVTGWEFAAEAWRSPAYTLPLARLIAEAPFLSRLEAVVVTDGCEPLQNALAGLFRPPVDLVFLTWQGH